MSEQYKGGVPLTGGLEVKGGGDSFPLVKAHDVYVDETHRLDEKLAEMGGGVGDADSNLNLENGEGEYSVKQISYEGAENKATGKGSMVIGHDSKACQANSVVMGGSSQAGLTYAEAQANGYVLSEADWSWAYGYLYVMGSQSVVKGWEDGKPIRDSFALGKKLKVSHSEQFSIGFYNADKAGNIFEVGNGSNDNRSNAFEVNRQGDSTVRRNLEVGGNLNLNGKFNVGTNIVTGANSVTVGYENHVDNEASMSIGSYNLMTGAYNCNLLAGNGCIVESEYSATLGQGLRNTYSWKTVLGRYNLEGANVLEVGFGDSENERKNVFVVTRDGRAKAYGAAKDPEDLVRKNEFDEALENLPSGGNTVSISGKWRIHSTPTTTLTLENVSFISGSSRYYKVYFGRTSTGRTSIGYYRTDGVIQACSNGFWATDYYAFIEFEDTYNISKKDYEAFLTNATPISKVFDRWAQLPIADEETINLFAKNDALFDEAGIYAFKVETLGTFTLWAGTRIDRVRMLEGTVRVQKDTDEGITGVLSADFTYAHDTTGPHAISMIEIGNNGLSIENTGATPWGIFYKVTKLA